MFIKPQLRGIDALGSGAWQASRGKRKHNGIDLRVTAGDGCYSNVDGVVTKIGRPYKHNESTKKKFLKSALRYVEVTCDQGLKHRFFYVKPYVSVGDPISVGSYLGAASDLKKIWPLMRNHVHFEVKTKDGKYLNPERFI